MAGADGCGRGDGGASARHDRGGQPPILGIAVFALFMALINASIKPVTQLIALRFRFSRSGCCIWSSTGCSCGSPHGWQSVCSVLACWCTGSGGRCLALSSCPLSRGSSAASCVIERRRTSGMMVGFRASHDCLAASRRPFADTPVPSATHRARICTEVKAMIRYQRGVFGRKLHDGRSNVDGTKLSRTDGIGPSQPNTSGREFSPS